MFDQVKLSPFVICLTESCNKCVGILGLVHLTNLKIPKKSQKQSEKALLLLRM